MPSLRYLPLGGMDRNRGLIQLKVVLAGQIGSIEDVRSNCLDKTVAMVSRVSRFPARCPLLCGYRIRSLRRAPSNPARP